MFRGSSHCSTSPPSHKRIFTISSTQDFPHREPPLRIWVIQLLEYTTPLSNTNNLYTRLGTKPTQDQPLTRGIRLKANNTTITSTLRGITIKPPQSPLTRGISTQPPQSPLTRGISQNKEGYNTWWFPQPQTNFPTKLDPNR